MPTELSDLMARLRPSNTGVDSTGGARRKKGSPQSVIVERRTEGAEIVEKVTIARFSFSSSVPFALGRDGGLDCNTLYNCKANLSCW